MDILSRIFPFHSTGAPMKIQDSTSQLLQEALERFGIDGFSEEMSIKPATVRRWARYNVPGHRINDLRRLMDMAQRSYPSTPNKFTFIDLFAGIGGIRKGFECIGGQCVFTSEWDKYAWETYRENFDTSHKFVGDINTVTQSQNQIAAEIPDHDVLLAGFPCQPFSLAGVSKKNSLGRAHGFKCEKQGNLFFKIRDIIKAKTPSAFLLENVKNLESHDRGNTYKVIMDTLRNELGYHVYPMIVDAKGFVPQHRERIYLVGFKEKTDFTWDDFIRPSPKTKTMKDILHPENGTEHPLPWEDYIVGVNGVVNPKYILSDKLWSYLKAYKEKHRKKGNGFGYSRVTKKDTARTLSARYHKDGSEILVSRGRGNPRRLTPRECSRLMGFTNLYFPGGFRIPVSDTQSYRQFGNSVVVPVIARIAELMEKHIMNLTTENSKSKQIEQLAVND